MNSIRFSLCCGAFFLLATGALRAEEPKPVPPVKPAETPKPAEPAKPAPIDWMIIFRDLQSPDTAVRDSAAGTFIRALEEPAKLSKKPYFAAFKTNLAALDAIVRDNAMKTVASLGLIYQNDRRRFPELIKDLVVGDAAAKSARLQALFGTLENILFSDHMHGLIEKLGDDNKETQDKAIAAIKALGGEAAEELANGLDDEKVQVKKMCAELLRELGANGRDAVSALVFKLRDEDDKFGRKLAVQVLENLGPNASECIDDLVTSLDDDDKILRRLCVNILKKIGPAYKSAVVDLVNYLTHDEKPVRALATELLLPLGADAAEGVSDLIDVIDEPVPVVPPGGVKPPPEQTPLLNDTDSKTRAVNVLAAIGPAAKAALPGLKKLMNSTDADLKEAAKTAIEKIEGEKK